MKTSQSAYGNTDGGTYFVDYASSARYYCSDLPSYDGNLGRKQFYEARGYTVTECYNQKTDNLVSGGFSLTQYRAEIDAGRPVLISLYGHSIVGVGYDTASSTIYIHDTWDNSTHSMTWGGSYGGMQMRGVRINNIQSGTPPSGPANDDFGSAIVISSIPTWDMREITGATVAGDDPTFDCTGSKHYNTVWYRYTPSASGTMTVNTENSNFDTVLAVWTGSRGSLVSQGCNDDYNGQLYSQVTVSVNAGTPYYIEAASYGSITSGNLYISFASGGIPASFNKTSPSDGATNQASALTLSWESYNWATSYQYCIDTSDNDTCNTAWVNTNLNTSVNLSGLTPGAWYYWQVRANPTSPVYANGSATTWWSFRTGSCSSGLCVQVRNANGDPVPYAPVFAYTSLDAQYSSVRWTDDYGYINLPVSAGSYILMTSSYDDHFAVVKNASAPSFVVLDPTGTVEVTFNAKKSDGSAMQYAQIIAYPSPYGFGHLGQTDDSGQLVARLTPLSGRTYDFVANDYTNFYHLIRENISITGMATVNLYASSLPTGQVNISLNSMDFAYFCPWDVSNWANCFDITGSVSMTMSTYAYSNGLFMSKLDGSTQWEYDTWKSITVTSGGTHSFPAGGSFSISTSADQPYYPGGSTASITNRIEDSYGNQIHYIGTYTTSAVKSKTVLYEKTDKIGTRPVRFDPTTKTRDTWADVYAYLAVRNPSNTLISQSQNWDTWYGHTFTMPNPGVYGVHTLNLSQNTGPLMGVISASNTFMGGNIAIPPAPVLIAPPTGSYTNNNTPAFSWNTAGNAVRYQTQISSLATFTSTVRDFTGTDTTYTPSALGDGLYYWRVRGFNEVDQPGAWSVVRSLTIDTIAPPAPALSLPADGAIVRANPTFTWLAPTGANAYQLEVATDSGFSNIEYTSSVLATTYNVPSPALTRNTYYWRVKARDAANNWSGWSTTRTLHYHAPIPVAPLLTNPASGLITNFSTIPTFTWNSVANGSYYRIQISLSSVFSGTAIDQTLGTGVFSYTPSGSPGADGLYYWRVAAYNLDDDLGPWSAARTFTLDTTPPAAPVLSSPADGATSIGTPTFSWLPPVGAIAYEFEIENIGTPHNSGTILTPSYRPGVTLPLNSSLGWVVRARDAAGNWSGWSLIRHVTILPPIPVAPALNTPLASAMLGDNTPTLTWNSVPYGATYQVQVSASATFTTVLQDHTSVDTTYTATTLADGLYYWRVRAYNITPAPGAWSAARAFTIDTTPPAAPVLSLPADGATPIGIPTFSWLASLGANAYEFQYATDSTFTSGVKGSGTIALTSYRPADMVINAGTTYYWHVRARDAAQNWSAWSAYRTVNPQTSLPAAPLLTAPNTGYLTNDNRNVEFKWNVVTNAVEYQIQFSTLATFASTIDDATVFTNSYTPTTLYSPDGLKYWRVRARNATFGYGPWSAARTFTIDTTPPPAPALSLPANGALVVGTPTFSWLAAVGANAYQFEIATDSGFSDVRDTSPVQAVTSYKPGPTVTLPLTPTVLYWHVRARDAAGNWGGWSAYRTVTILPPIPVAPVLKEPLASVFLNDNTPPFEWYPVAYGDQYQIQIAAVSTFTTVLQEAIGSGQTYTATTLADGLYYWRVRAYNITPVPGAWSAARTFTVDTTPPAVPVLSAPANGAIYRSNPTFSWLGAVGANAYQFQFASDNGFSNIEYTSGVLAVTSHIPNPAMTVGAHYWRVRSRDAAGNWSNDPGGAGWSTSRLVEVRMPLPLAPNLNLPANGSVQYTKTPTFTWNGGTYADSYNIQVATNYTFTSPQVDVNLPSGQMTYTPTSDLVPDGLRYWRVRGINIHGEPGTWSAARTFTINTSKQWTFMVYLAADNNLESAAVDDFIEMATAGSNSGVNIVVQFDRNPGYDTRYDDWTGTKRYYVTSGMTPTSANAVMDLGELNMGDPTNLQNFVTWAKTYYPASKYALVLWNHGGGFQPMAREPIEVSNDLGVAWDDTDGNDYLSNLEISTVLAAATTNGANKLELVGFDACLMAQMEVYQHVKAYAKAAAGSEETEPGPGWPYHTILADLNANPGWTGVNLANAIVNRYYASYGNDETQSAVQFGTAYDAMVATSFGNFVAAMRANLETNRTFIANALIASQSFAVSDYIDLSDFALQLYNRTSNTAIRSAASALITALNGVVTNNKAGSSWPNAKGISIFFPKSQSTWGAWAATYQANQWLPRDTAWNEFLNEYYYTNMTITLTWGANPYDLDSHLWLPAATPYHIKFSDKGNTNMTAFPYAYLDVDDTSSYGPENISIKQFLAGSYKYSVYNWTGDPAYPIKTSGATVRVYRNGALVKTYYASAASGDSANRWWNVFTYTNGVFTDQNTMVLDPGAPYDDYPMSPGDIKK